ncbi:MAG: hypothetical protein HOV87_12870 [Catenulispora sp.]|nr:hypothetical protein [Catenulispora sp.]
MRILLTESAPGAADEAERLLRAAGYDISFCHPGHEADGDGCVVLRGIGHCPLRTDDDIRLVVDARSGDAPVLPTQREFGSCCAVRGNVPLVVTGPVAPERHPWSRAAAFCDTRELVGVCERLTRPVEEALRAAAERVAHDVLQANGYDGDVAVTITGAAGSTAVFVHVLGASDGAARAEAAGMVRQVLRGRRDLDGIVTVVMVPRSSE